MNQHDRSNKSVNDTGSVFILSFTSSGLYYVPGRKEVVSQFESTSSTDSKRSTQAEARKK